MVLKYNMNLNIIELLKNGIYAEAVVDKKIFLEFLKSLYPVKIEMDLIRIGGENDGGYLLPNDLKNISVCFSPGVADNASFELDLLNKTGIESHLADYSVDGPPDGYHPKSFIKKYLGPVNDETYITLDSWIKSKEVENESDFILQMDIEGGEYLTLLTTNIENLKKFRIIVLEVHNVYAWSQKNFFSIISGLFDKILQEFYIVHNHPNNNDGLLNINDVEVPRTLELTFIRKDRTAFLGFRSDFPHILDRPNSNGIADLFLPQAWYESKKSNLSEKILLCRPQGGWNDILCSIEKCWNYAHHYNRKLVIDSTRSGIKDHFWKYFEPVESNPLIEYSIDYGNFDNLNAFPKSINGRISTFECDYSMEKFGFVDNQSQELISFNMSQNYDCQLLVHEQGWLDKEMGSKNLFDKIRFTKIVKDEINKRLSILPKEYISIHIRHTDYTTNYETFINSLKEKIEGRNILICSDNVRVIDFLKDKYPNSKVYRLSKFINMNDERLHYKTTNIFENNIEALSDLIGLALSEEFYFTNVNETPRPSGFSMLAQALFERKELVRKLISY